MIELTEDQRDSIEKGMPVRFIENGKEYVLVQSEVYDRLADDGPADDSWEPEEMDRLREESVALLDRYGKDQ